MAVLVRRRACQRRREVGVTILQELYGGENQYESDIASIKDENHEALGGQTDGRCMG